MNSYTCTEVVTTEHTAKIMASGNLLVYATPAMVAFMEYTACRCIDDRLKDNEDSVGIEINVKHLKALSVGKKVICTASITNIEGRKTEFDMRVTDESNNLIGTATHTRFIIDTERFLAKL